MFTGIVEELGVVKALPPAGKPGALRIAAHTVLSDAQVGDSIAVNGVCLTVTDNGTDWFSADVMPQTLAMSSLGRLSCGAHVNLERAMAASGRFGGHIVSGHIDGTGRIAALTPDGNATRARIACEPRILGLVVEQGSIAVDGISLTVSRLFADAFEVSIIPHTGVSTTLLERRVGDVVNLENDVVGKYVKRLMEMPAEPQEAGSPAAGLTFERLAELGY